MKTRNPMEEKELKALVSLLDDSDGEVIAHIEEKVLSLGAEMIPYLEEKWSESPNVEVQTRIENLIHEIQSEILKTKFRIWATEGNQDLLEGLWLLATLTFPDLELQKLHKEIDQLYYEAWIGFEDEMHHFDQISILNNFIFNRRKFRPNHKNFHAPANSYINTVLETQRGNPLSLCCIYMLLGQKLGIPLYGVNMANLFILTYKTEERQFYINVFNKGITFSRKEIDNYIAQLNIAPKPSYYEPCSSIAILIRAMNNLTISYKKLGDSDKVEDIKALLEILRGAV